MKITPAEIFLSICNVNEDGWTDLIYIEDLIKMDERFKSNNGCQWARKGSLLDKNYNLKRFHANELGGKGNSVVAIQLQGFKTKIENHSIPKKVRDVLNNNTCTILDVITTDMEIDHKNGKYSDEEYDINDFQRLSKSANDAKREHCKKCNATHIRYDATQLGYSVPYVYGTATPDFCQGCYWYDPREFNRIVSMSFVKEDKKNDL